nr:PTS sugar transporter subunit IIC [Leptotrichia sp. oral taxon 212]
MLCLKLLPFDLWGGSPFNQANRIFEEAPEKRVIVAGLNLPMLIEAYSERLTATSAHEIAKAILPSAKEEVKVRPEELQPEEKQPKAAVTLTTVGLVLAMVVHTLSVVIVHQADRAAEQGNFKGVEFGTW